MRRLRQTHTFALLAVPSELYDLVRTKLVDAGYEEQVNDDDKTIDMHGLALTPEVNTNPPRPRP